VQSDYDSPWKEALDIYFEAFMAFCFSEIHGDINWSRNYESLDTELQEVVRDAETGRRLADKLVKVWLNDGKEVVVLVHVEIQSQVQSDFAKRMYIYNHRLFDRYDQEVISLAVLGDEQAAWRPTSYGYTRWGFESSLQFPMVKLLDYQQRWSELEQSSNPFAVVIMAHLSTLETVGDPQRRLQSKLSLVRGLYQRGYTRNQILELFRLIEWMMVLPVTWDRSFRQELKRVQEENRMPYITGFERDGMVINARENLIEVLQTRFEVIPDELSSQIQEIEDLAVLKRLHKQSITIASVEEFGRLVDEVRSHPTE
jgi:hypothetical protein